MTNLVRLRRRETSMPWGFRLNGGTEFDQPLYIQKVTPKGIAHKAGLKPGDAILQIRLTSTVGMSHANAKMEIIRAGNELDFVVERDAVPIGEADPKSPEPRAQVIETQQSPDWRTGLPPQDPNVQSRSFKVLQQQLNWSELPGQ